jgi:restriction endonuclease Mrr
MHGPDITACSSRTIEAEAEPEILLVECKRYREDRPVGVREVRKLVHWLDEEYKATLGMVVTTSSFRRTAQSLVIEEMNRLKLSLVDQNKGNTLASTIQCH